VLQGFDSIVDCIHDAATNKINIQLSWSGRGIDNDPVPGVSQSRVDIILLLLRILACVRSIDNRTV